VIYMRRRIIARHKYICNGCGRDVTFEIQKEIEKPLGADSANSTVVRYCVRGA